MATNTGAYMRFGRTLSDSGGIPIGNSTQTSGREEESTRSIQPEPAQQLQPECTHPIQPSDSFNDVQANRSPPIHIRSDDIIRTRDIIELHELNSKTCIIFVDLDNKRSFFSECVPDDIRYDNIFFLAVYNKTTDASLKTRNKRTGELYKYHLNELLKRKLAYEEKVGCRCNEADFRMVGRVEEMDDLLPKDIEFLIVSSDRSFQFLTKYHERCISLFHGNIEAAISKINPALKVNQYFPAKRYSISTDRSVQVLPNDHERHTAVFLDNIEAVIRKIEQDPLKVNQDFSAKLYFFHVPKGKNKLPDNLVSCYDNIMKDDNVFCFFFYRETVYKTKNLWYQRFVEDNKLCVKETPKEQKPDVPLMELIAYVMRMHFRLPPSVQFIISSDQLMRTDISIPYYDRSIIMEKK